MESKMIKINSIIRQSYATFRILLIAVSTSLVFTSCEQDYIPSTSESQQEIVVEGYVEVGDSTNPVFVVLSKSIPFLSTINSDKFSELFVKGGNVTVNDGTKEVTLNEVCLSQLPDDFKKEVGQLLGLNTDSLTTDICIYVDLLNQVTKEEGRRYDLTVKVGDKTLTATTTVPMRVPLFDFQWRPTPGKDIDTLSELYAKLSDPAGIQNFYRYLTAIGDGAFIPPFSSVTDDAVFDGKSFDVPIQKAERRGGDFNPEIFGYYRRGSKVRVKWCSIDKAHFDFWNTRDFSANSGGPFSSYTRIATNINGGLGIWGGYAVNFYEFTVPPR